MLRCCSANRSPDTKWSWVVCIAATMCNVLQFGFLSSFGVFLPVLSKEFNEGRERTAWAGSISFTLVACTGPFVVRLIEKFGQRTVTIAAGLISFVSLLSSSFVNHFFLLYFTHGVMFGIPTGTVVIAGYTIVRRYFRNKRALTTGITASGISLGIMSFNPITEKLLELFGWRNAFRVVAGLMLLVCLLACTYHPIQPESGDEEQQQQERKTCVSVIDLTVFKNVSYTVGALSIATANFGYSIPYIHLVRFAKDLDVSSKDASLLLIYIGLGSSVSRIVIGQVIDKKWLTALQTVQLCVFTMGIANIILALTKDYSHFVIFALVYGIGSGGLITSQNVFFQNTLEPEKSAVGLGMGCLVLALPLATGPPFVGFIADKLSSYVLSFYIVAGMMIFAAAFPFVLCCPKCKKARSEVDELYHCQELFIIETINSLAIQELNIQLMCNVFLQHNHPNSIQISAEWQTRHAKSMSRQNHQPFCLAIN